MAIKNKLMDIKHDPDNKISYEQGIHFQLKMCSAPVR